MNTKKLFLSLALLSSLCFFVFGEDLISLEKKAKSESAYYENALSLSLKSLNSAELLNYDKEHKFSTGIRSGSWSESLSDVNESKVSFTPYFTYESPEDNTTSVSLSSPIDLYYKSDGTTRENTYSPSLSISQKVLLNGVADNTTELSKQTAVLQAHSSVQKVELQYEMALYNAISSVLTSEGALAVQRAAYNLKKASFDSEVNVDGLKEGEYAYDTLLSELKAEENRLVSAENTYNTALSTFKDVAGFDFDGVENIRSATFDFAPKLDGNSDVRIAYLNMQKSKNQYDILLKNDDRVLTFSLDTQGGIKTNSVKSWDVGGGVAYKDTNISLSASASGSFKEILSWKAEPRVNFEFNYQSGAYESETKRLRLQNAEFDYRSASYFYEKERLDYATKAESMKNSIKAKEIEAISKTADYNNAKKNYELYLVLKDKGYYSKYEIESEEAKYKQSENAYKAFLLSALVLENESKILNI